MGSAAPLTIFVVEDSAIMTNLLTRLLAETAGVRLVGSASDSASAIAALQRDRPDVVIIDLLLENGSGFDVLAALNDLPRRPVAFVLSNLADASFRAHAHLLGADGFFDKSTQITVMFEGLRDLAERRGAA